MIRAATCATACVALAQGAWSAPAVVPGYTYVKSLSGIDEYRLEANGLDVLLKPDHSAPVVTFNVVYHVGSRNEVTGTTGSTHLLEHLMFKGSAHYNPDSGNGIDRVLEKVGAEYNATTSEDRTHYFATVGRDSLERYIAVESDRMRNLLLRESDRQSEMTVVRNEYERGENDPTNVLYKEMVAMAFQAQPYHHSTIGWRSDIEKVPIEKLREFYDTFYWPNNATAILVGDFDKVRSLELIRKYYGAITKSPKPIPESYTTEPPQQGPRRLIIKRAGQAGYVAIAYKSPDARNADIPALTVLSVILSTGKNSRLSRALEDKSLATAVSASMRPMHDPGLFDISATLAPGVPHQQVEDVILTELDGIKREGVTAAEVTRAATQYLTELVFERDGTMSVAWSLNEWVAVGDWTLYGTFPDKIAKVTAADVQRVARAYLNQDQSTTGWFVPVEAK